MKIILEPAKILRENPHTRRPYSSTKTGSKKFFIRGKNFHHTSGSLPINFLRRIPRRPPTRAVRRTTAGLGTARAKSFSHVYSTPSIIFLSPLFPLPRNWPRRIPPSRPRKPGRSDRRPSPPLVPVPVPRRSRSPRLLPTFCRPSLLSGRSFPRIRPK